MAIHTPSTDCRAMFELPRFVLKSRAIIVEQGGIRRDHSGQTMHVEPEYDEGVLPEIQKWFEAYHMIQFASYRVVTAYLAHGGMAVACGR